MKTYIKWYLLVTLIVTWLLPVSAGAQSAGAPPPGAPPPETKSAGFNIPSNYFVFKGGIYSPQTNDLDGFDTGFNGELAIGHYFNRNWAVEFGAGYFQTSASQTLVIPSLGLISDLKVDIDVMPVTLALKGIIPMDRFELYGIGGIGAYFVWTKGRYGGFSESDSDVLFGGFAGLGMNYNFSPTTYVGLEGKYLWTSDASFSAAHVKYKLDGIIATLNLGFRF